MKNKWIYIAAGVLVVAIIIIVAVVSSNKKEDVDIPVGYDGVTDVLETEDGLLGDEQTTIPEENQGEEQEGMPEDNSATGNTASSDEKVTTSTNKNTTASSGTKKSEVGSFVASDGTKFEIVLVEDVVEGDTLIKWIKVRFSEYVPEAKVKAATEKAIEHLTSIKDVNGIALDCYYTQDINGSYNVARVIWAPYGDWSQTVSVKSGDYSKNEIYILMAPEPEPVPDIIAGMSKDKAEKAYVKYFGSQAKLLAEATAKYPDDSAKRQEYLSELNNKLINDISKEYGMTANSIGDLILAGLKYNWSY